MTRWNDARDYAGLIAIKLDAAAADRTILQGVVSAALRPFGTEPLDEWEPSGQVITRLRREGEDPTTCRLVLAVEQTLGAAVAIREATLGHRGVVTLACDIEPSDANPERQEYWARRQRLKALVESGGARTLCRRDLQVARPLTLERIQAHFEQSADRPGLELVAGPAVSPIWELGRSVTPYLAPQRNAPSGTESPRDIATVASPDLSTRIVLIVADAWVGKSHVAKKLLSALRSRGITECFTSFESAAPFWPDEEFLAQGKPRVWIVDAIDEADRHREPIKKLQALVRRPALTTLVFARPDSTLPQVEEVLGLSAGAPANDGIERSKVRLLPLDRDQAQRELEGQRLSQEEFDHLWSVAGEISGTPDRHLTFEELSKLSASLKANPATAPPDLRHLRAQIARYRCTLTRAGAEPVTSGGDEMLKAAQLLAATAALSNERQFHFGTLAPGFNVNDAIPQELREAARALTRTTALMRAGEAWTIAAAHLEEDLAAGYLADAITSSGRPLEAQALRTLLTDGYQPRPELERVIQRVREVVEGAVGEEKLRKAVTQLEPGEAVRRFKDLLEVVRTESPPLWTISDAALKYLGTPQVLAEIGELLRAPEPEVARPFALRVALANEWTELSGAAVEIALSETEGRAVRHLAIEVARMDAAQLPYLRVLLQRISRDEKEKELAELRAEVVRALFEGAHLSALEAARLCPAINEHHGDFRLMAVVAVGSRLDIEATRAVLDELRGAAEKTIEESVCDELREPAVSVFLAFLHDRCDADHLDVARLAYIVENRYSWDGNIDQLLGRQDLSESLRRDVYLQLDLSGTSSNFFDPQRDASWLVDHASSSESLAGKDNVVADLVSSVLSLEARDPTVAERGREVLRKWGAGDRFEARLASIRDWKMKEEGWARARQSRVEEARKHAAPVERVIDTFLGEQRDASVRLHVLGSFFFRDRPSDGNGEGTLDDFSDDKKEEIIGAVRGALLQATPSPIPEGSTFSSFILDEGHAFTRAVLWRRDWLDSDQITRWLPAGLFSAVDTNSRLEDLLERCFEIGPAETREAMIRDIERSARQGYTATHRIPAVLWTDRGFRSDLGNLVLRIGREERNVTALGTLLDALLDAYDETIAPPEVRSLLGELLANATPAVHLEAVRAWFRRWPSESVDRAIADASTLEAAAAVFAPYRMASMGARPSPKELPVPIAARVLHRLLTLDPPIPSSTLWRRGPIGDAESLAKWRDDLVRLCIERRSENGVADAIEAIRCHPTFGAWLSAAEAGSRVNAALAPSPRPWPTADQVAAMLRGALALVHTDADLALLLAEILRAPWDPEDTILVYDGKKTKKRSHEEKLQVLVRKKLIEGMRNARPTIEATPIREPNERVTDEPDFLVVTTNHTPRLEVPVEVKWADSKTASFLESQLGERYIGNAGRTHGVFFVGWTGKPSQATLASNLEAARLRQAAKARTIHVVTKDLRRPTRP